MYSKREEKKKTEIPNRILFNLFVSMTLSKNTVETALIKTRRQWHKDSVLRVETTIDGNDVKDYFLP